MKAHGKSGRGVAADDRMLDLLKPLARPKLFTFDELSDCVERGGGKMTPLRLLGKFFGGKLADEMGEAFDTSAACASRYLGFPIQDPQESYRSSSSARTRATCAAYWS